MITGNLLDDVLLGVKDKLTMMSGIGLESVNTFFQPPAVPNVNAKPPKIMMRIKDVSSGNAYANQRFVLLTLHDKRKKQGQWKIQLKLSELEQTFAKIFIRMKDFRSLRICVAGEAGMVSNYPYQAPSRYQEAREKLAVQRTTIEMMLTCLSGAFIGAASVFPQSTITVHGLFFPPHSAGMTTLMDSAINLIALLGPSLTKLRLSTGFPHSNGVFVEPGECQPLLELIAAKCTGLQKLKMCGDLQEPDLLLLQHCLRSLTSLRCFEHTALGMELQLPLPLPHWLLHSFELNRRLKRLTVSYMMLAWLAEPSASAILSQLTTLNISFDWYCYPVDDMSICYWIVRELQKNNGQGSVLHGVLTGMSAGSLVSMQLKCSNYVVPASVVSIESLVKTILTLGAVTKKAISATFLFCRSDEVLTVTERLKNAHPLFDVQQTSPDFFTIHDGTATCVFALQQ